MERRRDEKRQARFEQMKSEVALRLRSVCEQMPASEFDQLVERIVALKIKYTMRRADDLFLEEAQRRE